MSLYTNAKISDHSLIQTEAYKIKTKLYGTLVNRINMPFH